MIRQLHEYLVEIAPSPTFWRIEAFDDGVLCRTEVGRRMLPDRLIATPNVATLAADAEMEPLLTNFQAFLAAKRLCRDRSNRRDVSAS
jgi:hypothetical protein